MSSISCGTKSARASPRPLSEAAAQGDRSENAEYTYGKKRLHEIDRRVRFLRKRLEGMAIVDPAADLGRRDPKRVYFGAWVQIENTRPANFAGIASSGPTNSTWHEDYISMDSPLGQSLLGKRLDDEISVELPGGAATLTVVAISLAIRRRTPGALATAVGSLKPPECS